jgi:hypothetical protein
VSFIAFLSLLWGCAKIGIKLKGLKHSNSAIAHLSSTVRLFILVFWFLVLTGPSSTLGFGGACGWG